MQRVKIVYWEEEGAWLGYLQEYPDYWTQGETLEDLQEHLRDLYQGITRGEVPEIGWARFFADPTLVVPADFETGDDPPPLT